MTYQRLVNLSPEDVRACCIKHGFYTKGDCEQYSTMLRKAKMYKGDNIEVLVDIATDIYYHTDKDVLVDYLSEIPGIMFDDFLFEKESIAHIMTMLERSSYSFYQYM